MILRLALVHLPHRIPARVWAWVLIVGFVILNGLDFLLTWLLIGPHSDVCEGNPIAARVLSQYGWAGLFAYKCGCVVVVVAIALLALRRRPVLGRTLLLGGCAVLIVVVAYSFTLLARAGEQRFPPQDAEVRERGAALDQHRRRFHSYLRMSDTLAQQLAAGRISLPDATMALEGYLEDLGYCPAADLRRQFPSLDYRASLAARLVRDAGCVLQDCREHVPERLRELESAFASCHGCTLPPDARPTCPQAAPATPYAPAMNKGFGQRRPRT